MHNAIQKFVDSGLFNEKVGQYIQDAIDNHETVIVAGHRSTGSRPLMANLMMVAKASYESVQVKSAEDLAKPAQYYLIPSIPNIDFEQLIADAIDVEGAALVTIKEPEQPVSFMKILKNRFKNHGFDGKVYHEIALRKEDGVPYTESVTKLFVDEKGKVKKEKFEF